MLGPLPRVAGGMSPSRSSPGIMFCPGPYPQQVRWLGSVTTGLSRHWGRGQGGAAALVGQVRPGGAVPVPTRPGLSREAAHLAFLPQATPAREAGQCAAGAGRGVGSYLRQDPPVGLFSLHRLCPRVRAVSSSQWCHPESLPSQAVAFPHLPLEKPNCASLPRPRGLGGNSLEQQGLRLPEPPCGGSFPLTTAPRVTGSDTWQSGCPQQWVLAWGESHSCGEG